ncbi:hypothetical protein [Streptomyces sp. Je 1-369]|uniref:hypothetical protein n=1 Tax=Streptomyces sp. Je 1-369 TaxID=2966192 RepID=UPI002286624F|nr:hypothetical protein [Streptomyces sp. Je 1-369]WAL93670.1 hypothetical protein NOO62_03685 [Streptomyces sp. Je 1-369]
MTIEFGDIDILVSKADSATRGPLEQLSGAALQRQPDVNFLGIAALTRPPAPNQSASTPTGP